MQRIYILMVTLLVLATSCGERTQTGPCDLRCEGLDSPLGIDNTTPHFSWKLRSAQPAAQVAYEILVASRRELLKPGQADLWDSGEVTSDASVMVPYGGKALLPRQLCYWKVCTRTADGQSAWSAVQRFAVGICQGEEMRGEYIGLGGGEDKAVLLTQTFDLRKKGPTALLHVNSLGYHEVYLNGKRVSEAALAPAVSQLDRRSLIVTYDVGRFLKRGENRLTLWIGSGWYKKATFRAAFDGPAVRAELDVLDGDTWCPVVQTDGEWQAAESGYYDTGTWRPWEFGGERIDARRIPADLSEKSLARLDWQAATVTRIEGIEATPQMCQQTIVKETVQAADIRGLGDGRWLVDMGKALNGLFEVRLPALPEGTEVTAEYSDGLDGDGNIKSLRAADTFVASGREEGDVFRNRFNHHCFRYVLLSSLPARPIDARAHRIGMDVPGTGTFESSDADLNAIHEMVRYTMDCLTFSGYMVDCAHIERLGYGGDGNASTLSLQNMFEVAPLYMNWLQAWNDAIQPDGGLPHTAPCPYKAGGGPYWCSFIVQAPWRTWMNFGDDRLLHRCYASMKLWLTYVDANTRDGLLQRWPDLEYRKWYLGDWLAPEGVDVRAQESVDLVDNCALSQSYGELIQIAAHLGEQADVQDFTQRREQLNRRIHETFYHPETHTYGTGSQLDMAYPLLVGAVLGEVQDSVQAVLLGGRDHLGVGLVGVPVLTEWLTRSGQADFMYTMLRQEDYPGYLYMIRNGATGTWEDWRNPRSSIHNCFNGIDSWFVQALGGIIPIEPGYKTMRIEPQAPQGLQWVRVERETPYGPVRVAWERTGEGVRAHIEVPNGTTALLQGQRVGSGTYDIMLDTK